MPIIEPFERNTAEYEAWFQRHRPAYESELAAVGRLLPRGATCEVGVGTGRFAAPLNITLGIDPSPAMLDRARQRGVQVILAQAESLPLATCALDGVLMVTTVCFLDDPKSAFHEVRRILRAEGTFVLGFVDSDSPLGRQYHQKSPHTNLYRPGE